GSCFAETGARISERFAADHSPLHSELANATAKLESGQARLTDLEDEVASTASAIRSLSIEAGSASGHPANDDVPLGSVGHEVVKLRDQVTSLIVAVGERTVDAAQAAEHAAPLETQLEDERRQTRAIEAQAVALSAQLDNERQQRRALAEQTRMLAEQTRTLGQQLDRQRSTGATATARNTQLTFERHERDV